MNSSAMKQEFFIVHENVQAEGIRQDRWTLEPRSTTLHIQGKSFPLQALSCFDCEAQLSEQELQELKDIFQVHTQVEAELRYKNQDVHALQLRWNRRICPLETGLNQVELDVVGNILPVEVLKALHISSGVLESQTARTEKLAAVPAALRYIVYELRDWMEHLKNKIDKLEEQTPLDNLSEAEEYRKTIISQVSVYLLRELPLRYKEVEQFAGQLTPAQLQTAVEFFREQAGHLFYGAPFARRAYFKPRGYAGDFEMMNHLYRNEMVGRTLFDQCLHKYFIDEPSGVAVKNRGYYLHEKISQLFASTDPSQPLKILSIASGPAMEQQLFLQHGQEFYGRQAEFTCLDQDGESLRHAQRQLISKDRLVGSGFTFKFNNMAIKNVIGRGLPEKDYDLIYSAGLFDYFTEQIARATAMKMLSAVKEGGHIIIGNFSKDNPCSFSMDLVLDWQLIYRSETDLLRIFQGLGSKIWVEKEPLGVNLFVVIQK